MPVISVLLPVFNAEKFVGAAIESVLSQTFTNFELILINDGSTDGSLNILDKFKKLDIRVVVVTRENRGLVETLNEGINLAKGKWVARMDADDIAFPQRFERQLQWLSQTDADICGSWIKNFGAGGTRIIKHPQSDDAIKMELLFGCSFAHPTVIMKTELVKKLRYDQDWDKAEDYDLWIRAACAGWKMTNVPEVLLMYRQHNRQISTASSAKQQQLTQEIRHRYGHFVFDKMQFNEKSIDAALNLRELYVSKPNMNLVDLAFVSLLQHNHGEAKAVILDHATRLYYRAASNSLDVAYRWHRLNRQFGYGLGLSTIIKLLFLSIFQINPSSATFQTIKKFYFSSVR